MQCDDVTKLQEWVLAWGDLARFEIVPLASSKDTAAAVKKHGGRRVLIVVWDSYQEANSSAYCLPRHCWIILKK